MAWLLESPADDANHDTPAQLFLSNNLVMQLPVVGSVPLASVLVFQQFLGISGLQRVVCDENILLLFQCKGARPFALQYCDCSLVVTVKSSCSHYKQPYLIDYVHVAKHLGLKC